MDGGINAEGTGMLLPILTSLDGFLLNVPDQTMANLGVDKVGQEEHVEKQALHHQHGGPKERARLLQAQEREQVHAL